MIPQNLLPGHTLRAAPSVFLAIPDRSGVPSAWLVYTVNITNLHGNHAASAELPHLWGRCGPSQAQALLTVFSETIGLTFKTIALAAVRLTTSPRCRIPLGAKHLLRAELYHTDLEQGFLV